MFKVYDLSTLLTLSEHPTQDAAEVEIRRLRDYHGTLYAKWLVVQEPDGAA